MFNNNITNSDSGNYHHNNIDSNINDIYPYKDYRNNQKSYQRSRNFYRQHPGMDSKWNNNYYQNYNYPVYNAPAPFFQNYGASFGNFRKNPDDVDLSKKLAYILRHGAYHMNLYMNRSGYVYVIDILRLPQFRNVRENDIIRIVQKNEKQRFHLTHDRNYLMIGATQGHTLQQVDQLELYPITDAKDHPCVVHGTTYKAWKNIKDSGLKTMGRTHIHFARGEPGDGRRVISGMRNSSQVLIYIDLEKALESGIKFFLSKNEVILSKGNKDGVISPDFFKEVLDRKTRKWPAEVEKIATLREMPKNQRNFHQQYPAARSNPYYNSYNFLQRYDRPFIQGHGTRSFRTENRKTFNDVDISKKLAYILRHGAYHMNLYMNRSGYVYVIDILKLPQFRNVRENDIIRIVQKNEKQRFHLTHDRNYLMIGATQGHTLQQVDQLELYPITDAKDHPCVVHGTTYKAWKNIKDSGLKTMGRTHIHFARGEPGDGRRVISGMRNSSQVLIYIDLEKALERGIKFFLSKNEVILSKGNKDGVISPDFFKKVLDRKTRKWPASKNKLSTKANIVTHPDRN